MMRKMSITGFLNFKIYVFETKLNLLMYFYMVQFLFAKFFNVFPPKVNKLVRFNSQK